MMYFFHDSCSFPYAKNLLKVSDHFVERIQHESITLNVGVAGHTVLAEFDECYKSMKKYFRFSCLQNEAVNEIKANFICREFTCVSLNETLPIYS